MLKKRYLLVAVLSFMFTGPAFSMEEGGDSTSDPISMTDTPRKQETVREEDTLDPKASSPGNSAAHDKDLKDASLPSAKLQSGKSFKGPLSFPHLKD